MRQGGYHEQVGNPDAAMVEERPMTAWDVLDVDGSTIQDALRGIELPAIDLTRLSRLRDDLAGFDRSRVDLSRLELPSLDLGHLDLGRLTRRADRRNVGFLAVRPTPLFILGVLAAIGGMLFGSALAYFLHPAEGPRRRRWLKRRLGLAPTRPGGKGHHHEPAAASRDPLVAVPIETGTPSGELPDATVDALGSADEQSPEQANEQAEAAPEDVTAEQPAAD